MAILPENLQMGVSALADPNVSPAQFGAANGLSQEQMAAAKHQAFRDMGYYNNTSTVAANLPNGGKAYSAPTSRMNPYFIPKNGVLPPIPPTGTAPALTNPPTPGTTSTVQNTFKLPGWNTLPKLSGTSMFQTARDYANKRGFGITDDALGNLFTKSGIQGHLDAN